MARFRRTYRRVARRARPQRRRRRIFRRKRSRRVASGNLWVKLTKVTTIAVPTTQTSVWSAQVKPTDFPEFVNLAPNFEAFKFTKMRLRVMPMQNVSNNSSSLVPGYCILPWHQENPETKHFNDYMSIDKAKYYRQTQAGHMTFVINTLTAVRHAGVTALVQTKWKPRIELNSEAYAIDFYSGLIAFQGNAEIKPESKSYFNIITDVWCLLINQKTLK